VRGRRPEEGGKSGHPEKTQLRGNVAKGGEEYYLGIRCEATAILNQKDVGKKHIMVNSKVPTINLYRESAPRKEQSRGKGCLEEGGQGAALPREERNRTRCKSSRFEKEASHRASSGHCDEEGGSRKRGSFKKIRSVVGRNKKQRR